MIRIALFTVLLVLAAPAPADPADDARTQLNYGYGQLYWAATRLQHIDKALWLKSERQVVDDVISDLAALMAEHAEAMGDLQAGDGVMVLDDQGLPKYELAKRWSVFTARGLDVGTPIVGRTGIDFERTLLLTLAAALNQQRHLADVMVDDEPVDEYRAWLADATQALDALYARIESLLESDYFRAAVPG